MSQWECVLQNLGEWHGSFTQFSPQGDEWDSIPSSITVKGRDDNRAIDLVLKRFYAPSTGEDPGWRELSMTFSAPGSGALLFESGAFSDGPRYASSTLTFGAEFCLVTPGRRSRQVQMFDTTGQCQQVTLIREKRATCAEQDVSPFGVQDLLGTWQQHWVTRDPARPETCEQACSTLVRTVIRTDGQLPLSADYVEWSQHPLVSDDARKSSTVFSQREPVRTVLVQRTPSLLSFEQEGHLCQTLLLPDGAFATFPVQLQKGHPFFVESGWLMEPGLCQRLVRRYNASGDWVNVSWIRETRI